MSDAGGLRDRARRCFRLARTINDPDAIAKLEEMGRELEAKASQIEREEARSEKSPPSPQMERS
jgi:hypothetical protein